MDKLKWLKQKITGSGKKIIVTLVPKYNSDNTPINIAVKTVHDIVKNYPPPYRLLIGSSIPDRAMLIAWAMSGEKFYVVQPSFTDFGPIGYGESICKLARKLKIIIQPHHLSLRKFFEFECIHWANRYRTANPRVCARIKMMSTIEEGTIIMGGSLLDKSVPAFDYDTLGIVRYANVSGKNIIPFFFLENEELAFSFWPILKSLDPEMSNIDDRITWQFELGGFNLEMSDNNDAKALDAIESYYASMFSDKVKETRDVRRDDVNQFDRIFKIPLRRKFKNPVVEFRISDCAEINKN